MSFPPSKHKSNFSLPPFSNFARIESEPEMATAIAQTNRNDQSLGKPEKCGGGNTTASSQFKHGEGLREYYEQRIQELQLLLRHKVHNLQRLEAQRNELNSRGNSLSFLVIIMFLGFLLID